MFLRDNGQTEAKSFFLETDIDIVAQDLPEVLSEATFQGCKRLASVFCPPLGLCLLDDYLPKGQ